MSETFAVNPSEDQKIKKELPMKPGLAVVQEITRAAMHALPGTELPDSKRYGITELGVVAGRAGQCAAILLGGFNYLSGQPVVDQNVLQLYLAGKLASEASAQLAVGIRLDQPAIEKRRQYLQNPERAKAYNEKLKEHKIAKERGEESDEPIDPFKVEDRRIEIIDENWKVKLATKVTTAVAHNLLPTALFGKDIEDEDLRSRHNVSAGVELAGISIAQLAAVEGDWLKLGAGIGTYSLAKIRSLYIERIAEKATTHVKSVSEKVKKEGKRLSEKEARSWGRQTSPAGRTDGSINPEYQKALIEQENERRKARNESLLNPDDLTQDQIKILADAETLRKMTFVKKVEEKTKDSDKSSAGATTDNLKTPQDESKKDSILDRLDSFSKRSNEASLAAIRILNARRKGQAINPEDMNLVRSQNQEYRRVFGVDLIADISASVANSDIVKDASDTYHKIKDVPSDMRIWTRSEIENSSRFKPMFDAYLSANPALASENISVAWNKFLDERELGNKKPGLIDKLKTWWESRNKTVSTQDSSDVTLLDKQDIGSQKAIDSSGEVGVSASELNTRFNAKPDANAYLTSGLAEAAQERSRRLVEVYNNFLERNGGKELEGDNLKRLMVTVEAKGDVLTPDELTGFLSELKQTPTPNDLPSKVDPNNQSSTVVESISADKNTEAPNFDPKKAVKLLNQAYIAGYINDGDLEEVYKYLQEHSDNLLERMIDFIQARQNKQKGGA